VSYKRLLFQGRFRGNRLAVMLVTKQKAGGREKSRSLIFILKSFFILFLHFRSKNLHFAQKQRQNIKSVIQFSSR
jgi:hypothetical protein